MHKCAIHPVPAALYAIFFSSEVITAIGAVLCKSGSLYVDPNQVCTLFVRAQERWGQARRGIRHEACSWAGVRGQGATGPVPWTRSHLCKVFPPGV